MDIIILIEKIMNQFLEKKQLIFFENKLKVIKNKYLLNLKEFLKISTLIGTIFLLTSIIISFYIFNKNPQIIITISILSFLIPFFVLYIIIDIFFESVKRKKEDLLSDVLLEASVFCDESSTEQIIKKIGNSEFFLISDDFKQAFTEIKNGSSIEEALERIKFINNSKTYSRVIDLFLQGYLSGARISTTLKETAEDLLKNKAIIKERQAVMLVTKYTLLLSAGLIVPSILGSISGLVTGLSFNSIGEIGIGLSQELRKELFNSASIGTNLYIIEYSLLSSFFLAIQEGNKKNFWIYASILTPISIIVFIITKTL